MEVVTSKPVDREIHALDKRTRRLIASLPKKEMGFAILRCMRQIQGAAESLKHTQNRTEQEIRFIHNYLTRKLATHSFFLDHKEREVSLLAKYRKASHQQIVEEAEALGIDSRGFRVFKDNYNQIHNTRASRYSLSRHEKKQLIEKHYPETRRIVIRQISDRIEENRLLAEIGHLESIVEAELEKQSLQIARIRADHEREFEQIQNESRLIAREFVSDLKRRLSQLLHE